MFRWLMVLAGFAGLFSIRVLEDKIFYDPFLVYFKSADQSAAFPDFVWGKLIIGYLFRFVLNLIFSLAIIHFLFKKPELTKQAFFLILLVFIIVFPVYIFCIYNQFQVGYLFSFYVRRFIIQPLTLLILLPTFYYSAKKQ